MKESDAASRSEASMLTSAGDLLGEEVSQSTLCRAEDLIVFAHATGFTPLFRTDDSAQASAAWVSGHLAALALTQLPGPGTQITRMTLDFPGHIVTGETLHTHLSVIGTTAQSLSLAARATAGDHRLIAEGTLEVTLPDHPVALPSGTGADVRVHRHQHFRRIHARARSLPPLPTAVVCPHTEDILRAALEAAEAGLITPLLIGAPDRIAAAGPVPPGMRIIAALDDEDASAKAVALVNAGEAEAIMKGHLHTDVLLHPIVARTGGLRTARRLSHVFVFDVPGLDHPLLISDAAINIAPDLAAKADIIQNAIHLAHAIGIELPKVGVLSAVETCTPSIPSTLDAAILSKMADRGQITGGLVDGPLALDNAVDLDAARTKGISSLVAGRADILIAPNLEAGNILAKELTFLTHADAGGIVMGATCPIILTSRADSKATRLASCAIARLVAAQ